MRSSPCRFMIGGLSVAMGLSVAPAFGTVVQIRFEGTLDYVQAGLPISDKITAGMPFEGTYSYELEVPDLAPDDTSYGYYAFPTHCLTVTIGMLTFSTSDSKIAITDYSNFYDYFVGNLTSPFSAYGMSWSIMGVGLTDYVPTPAYTDELPQGAPNLDDFLARQFVLTRVAHIQPSLRGTITELTRFPEPSTLMLLLFGTAGMAKHRRPSKEGAAPKRA